MNIMIMISEFVALCTVIIIELVILFFVYKYVKHVTSKYK